MKNLTNRRIVESAHWKKRLSGLRGAHWRTALLLLIAGCQATIALAQDNPPVVPPTPAERGGIPISAVTISGNSVLSNEVLVKRALAATANRPSDRETIQLAVRAVLGEYQRHGYQMAAITDAEVTPDGVLHLTVAEGVIRKVIIKGNTRTRRHTILQALSVRPGTVYRESTVRQDRLRLGRLGIFADLGIAPQVPGTPDEPAPAKPEDPTQIPPPPPSEPPVSPEDIGKIDVIVRVKDEPTVNVAATVGYTDAVGAVGFFDVAENNLLGMGHRVEVFWQRTARTTVNNDGTLTTTDSRTAAGLSYSVPPLGTRSLAFGAQVYNQNTIFLPYISGGRDSIRSYERRSGARGRIGKLLSNSVEGYLTVRRDIVGYDPIPTELNAPLDALANARGTVGALGIDLIVDQRDSVDSPQRGYRHELQFERAGLILGGNRVYSQGTLDLRAYMPLQRMPNPSATTRKILQPVVAGRLMGGYSTGDVPLSEQFFLGGFDLLRGYNLFSIRGDRFLLGTAEARVPVGSGLQAVAFTDIGNAWLPGQSFSARSLKASIGLGLRFLSPIGPIRLDAAYGSSLQTYISLGQSF